MKKIKSKTKNSNFVYINEEINLENYSIEMFSDFIDVIYKKVKELMKIS